MTVIQKVVNKLLGAQDDAAIKIDKCFIEDNKKKCSCTYEPCSRKGKCCECISYHWKYKELPACLFPPEVEKTYDRSLARFLKIYASEQG